MDLAKLEIVYAAAVHATRHPAVSGGSLMAMLTDRRKALEEEVDELEMLIQVCKELLREGH